MQQRRRRYAYFQKSWSGDFIPRTLFYWAKMYTEGFKEGEPYTSLTQCITINLVAESFKLNTQVHSVYRILEQRNYQQLTDLLEIHFLNLSKASQTALLQQEPIEKEQKLIHWLQFINTDDQKERAMLATTSPILQMLNEKIDVLSLNPVEKKLYESRMKLKSDIATISEVQFKAGAKWGIEQGKAEGKSLGLAEGSRQKTLETAKLMRKRDYPPAEICLMTGLSPAEVDAL